MRWMAPSGGIRLLLWHDKNTDNRKRVLECDVGNHKVLSFKLYYSVK